MTIKTLIAGASLGALLIAAAPVDAAPKTQNNNQKYESPSEDAREQEEQLERDSARLRDTINEKLNGLSRSLRNLDQSYAISRVTNAAGTARYGRSAPRRVVTAARPAGMVRLADPMPATFEGEPSNRLRVVYEAPEVRSSSTSLITPDGFVLVTPVPPNK